LDLSESVKSQNSQGQDCQAGRWKESKCLASEGFACVSELANLLLCATAYVFVSSFHSGMLSFSMLGNGFGLCVGGLLKP
jgi:hypothetical protein